MSEFLWLGGIALFCVIGLRIAPAIRLLMTPKRLRSTEKLQREIIEKYIEYWHSK